MAQSCSWSVSNINFGAVDTLSSANDDVTGTATITCSGLSGSTILLCPNLGYGSGGVSVSNRQMLNGTNPLSYQLYSDTWGGTIWGATSVGPPGPPAFTMTLPSSPLNKLIYSRVFGGQSTAPAGSYSTTYSTASHRRLYYQYCVGGPSTCPGCSILGLSSNASNFTVSATVASNCLVSATTLNFGSTGLLNTNVDATNSINVRCTPGTPWTVALNAGSGAGGTVSLRKMTASGGATVAYTIYRNSGRTEVWGDGTSGTFTVTGTGTGSAQAQTGYGRVPSQSTPGPALYTDTIVVTVTY